MKITNGGYRMCPKGGKMFIDLIIGNKTVSLACYIEIKELFENPKLPASSYGYGLGKNAS